MYVTARGWSRNMGDNELGSIDVDELRLNYDQNKRLWFDKPQLFPTRTGVEVHWGQELHLTGKYRMEITFLRSDIVQLFKAAFGSEINATMLDACGLTLSEDVKRQVLGTVKLADLTLGDLAKMTATPARPAAVNDDAEAAG